MFVPCAPLLKGLLADGVGIVASGLPSGVLKQAKMGLFTNQVPINLNTLLSDLVQPTYTGYALLAVTPWTGPVRQSDGSYQVISPDCVFQMQDSTKPTVAYGAFLQTSDAQPELLGGVVFDTPVALQTWEDAAVIVAQLELLAGSVSGDLTLL